MKRLRNVLMAAAFLVLLATLGVAQRAIESTASAQSKGTVQPPVFQVDPLWPKPLPNHWIIGSTTSEGKRVQQILYKGLGPVPAASR